MCLHVCHLLSIPPTGVELCTPSPPLYPCSNPHGGQCLRSKKMVAYRAHRPIIFLITFVLSLAAPPAAQQPIVLGDDTPKGHVVAENVLGNAMSIVPGSSGGTVAYALLKSPVSSYFRVDERTGMLVTRRPVDRDTLCVDSGLCCTRNTQNSYFSSIRPVDNGELGTVCALSLDVAVTTGHRYDSVPSTRKVFVEVKDENDHAPAFVIPNSASQYTDSLKKYEGGSTFQIPHLVLNISEAARVGVHRLALPLATDQDAPPFNVQQYVLNFGGTQHLSSSSTSSPERYFKLEVHKRELTPMSHFELEAPITGLDLLLVAPLDRETRPMFEFWILAIDGGSPTPLTGTLSVQIRVTDANDHEPRFERSSYETSVEEGHVVEAVPILKVVAHDHDEGVNARIRYSWWPDHERFGPDAKLLLDHQRLLTDEEIATTFTSPISPERLSQIQALPTYWFRLNEWTGEIFIHRALDYETKREFVFAIVATNPNADDADGSGGSTTRKSLKNSSSMTEVTINVINLNDEKPQISIDYVINSESVKHKRVMENGSQNHFIALIRAIDADAGTTKLTPPSLEDPYMVQMSGFQFGASGGGGVRLNRPDVLHSAAGGRVTCELGSHSENYTLTPSAQIGVTVGGSEYVLQTKTPLDREREQRQCVIIRCFDDGSPPKTSTATVEVEILDQNDCVPEVNIRARVPSTHRTHRSNAIPPLPRSRLADILQKAIPDWPMSRGSPFSVHPLVNAYEGGVPIVLVSVPENRPAGTVVASVQGVDPDAGENGRVTIQILKEDRRLPRVAPGPLTSGQNPGRYPEAKIDHNLPPVIIRSDINSADLFKLEANGDITTNRMIDREQSLPIRDELYLFLEARDSGHPVALTSYVLLAVEIEDENDNPPTFVLPQLNFPVLENEPSPQRIGEILVYDADAGPPREGYHEVVSDPLLLRVSEPPKHFINLFIKFGHGPPDLPFVIDSTPDGRFYLNATRSLDREVDEMFQFHVHASDFGRPSHLRHTSTAIITVSVVDVNDNPPEIIFPKPSTATTHIHTISYLEMPDTEILSINANDKDSEGENGKFLFELGPVLSSFLDADTSRLARTALDGDLFKLDAVKGLLKTQRRMTEADLGEHWLQLIVRDLGSPPLETRQIIRLAVDRSPPQFASNIRARIPPEQRTSPPVNYLGNSVVDSPHRHPGDWNGGERSISDVMMVVIIALMIAGLIVLIMLCFYLRHRQKLFFCLPDVCALFQKPYSSSNPYCNPKCVDGLNKTNEINQKGAKEGTFQGRVWTPRPPSPLSGGEFVATSSKCLPSGGGAFVSIASGTSRRHINGIQSAVTGVSDFFDKSPKLYTDCYHANISRSQTASQSSRLVPIPVGTLKPIISPNEEFPSPKSNFYNSAIMSVQSTVISPIHRSNLITSSGRYGEPLPFSSFYVQPDGVINPHHCRSSAPVTHTGAVTTMVCYTDGRQQHSHKSKVAPTQCSCDLLAFSNSLGRGRYSHKSAHYKSEPTLTACDDLEDDDADDPNEALVPMCNGARSEDYLGDVALGHRGHFPSLVPVDQKISISPLAQRQHQQQSLENYAVSFPKPQASYV
ncbi:Protocadherin-like wing polarity protein stan [Echinococcus granulosus]|uniref:Protocadherin 1 n=1 Tax=Echinococcus granulosus TaxID=6210 RepID=A0A068WGV6_ECHGR|nr:Protocadherin-like wing polarity protein stan [Echinococcus granulosus]CDS16908.1 protocadherin 1 [Echinococcus granulosus]